MIVHKVAIAALLSMVIPSYSVSPPLRAGRDNNGKLQGPRGKGNNKPLPSSTTTALFEDEVSEILAEVDDKDTVECDVYLAMGSRIPRSLEEEENDVDNNYDDVEDLLQCITDDQHIYEIEGLDPAEKERVTQEVTTLASTSAGGGGEGSSSHRYSFPAAKKTLGRGSGAKNVLEIPPRRGKYQANNIIPKKGSRGKNRGSNNKSNSRNLVIRHSGVSSVLLLRVEALDASTSCSQQDCAARTFGGYDSNGVLDASMNLITQIDDCSYGKLNFVLPEYDANYPTLINGTATVYVEQNVTGVHHGTVLDYALASSQSNGIVKSLDNYDHIMVYMPPGVSMGGAAAWGSVGGRYSWYHDSYSLMTGIHLHELGHNFGLGHSTGGEDCYMAYGGGDTRKCYNGPKSWYLGWYSEFHQVLDPVTTPSKLVELVGLADYDEAMSSGDPNSQAVVLKIDTYADNALYLTYNRKEKVNADAYHHTNELLLTYSTSADGSSTSWIHRALTPGQKEYVTLVEGFMILEIVACHQYYGTPDSFAVSIHVVGQGEAMCVPQPPIPSWGSAYAGALQDNMVGYYKFDDTLDSSLDSAHHGTIGGGSMTYIDGKVGRALSLDGSNDFVALPNVPDFNFGTSDFTITFWYRVSGDQSGTPAIITNKDWNSGLNPGWLLGNFGAGYNGDDLSINLSDGTVRVDSSSAFDVAFNEWHFVAMRIKRGGNMSLLRSSGGAYSLQEEEIGTMSGSVDSGLPILIGTSHGYTAKTKMDIDDLGIWARALSSEEVDSIYTAGLDGIQLLNAMGPPDVAPLDPVPTSSLIANYELESDVKDTSVNGLDATLEDGGGVAFATSESGSYLSLDNINAAAKSFATLPDSSLLDFDLSLSNFTVAFWHRTSVDFSTMWPSDISIVTNKNWQSGSNPGFTVGIGTNGRLEYNSGDGAGTRCDYDGPAGTMNDGEWHHVVLVQSPESFILYLDGRKVAQKSCALSTLSSGYPIRVGASWVYPAYYSGDVDKISIWNSLLSHPNIFDLYLKGRDTVMTYTPTMSMSPTHSPSTSPTPNPSLSPSKSPTSSPLSCDGVYDNTLCCGTDSVKQADYRGTISVTQGGIECQAWTEQSPHPHSRTPWNYPNSGLDSNYCRNPDGEPRSWCYTTDAGTRWDYCDIPSCGTVATPPPTTSNPTAQPTNAPSTLKPTAQPTNAPSTADPTPEPTPAPSNPPTPAPTNNPTYAPTKIPTSSPTGAPTNTPSHAPTSQPTSQPSDNPTDNPTNVPTSSPSQQPTEEPTSNPTVNPTPEPTTASPTETGVCTGIDNSCCGSFWFGKKQNDYRGTISKTVGGIECQAWSSQSPHGHSRTPSNYPNAGLDENYCRNPDGEPAAWCYTNDPFKRWDYCEVPSCPACEAGNPDQCGCSEVKQADYRGTISTTISGEECQAWSSQWPHGHGVTPGRYPNSGLDSNYCRNPDGEPRAWCYTTNPSKRWEVCDVQVCQ